MIKKRETKLSNKSKRSDIKFFLTICFLTETTQKCANFGDVLLVLHFLRLFYHLSDLDSPMTKLSKYER